MNQCGYNIRNGQYYIAADGSKCGHLVTDATTYSFCNDVVTTPFNSYGWGEPNNRIDSFKLACTKYALVSEVPTWVPPLS